jgi:hypothetical protein
MPSLSPAALPAPGERLRSLREESNLVIRSGAMAHSLGVFRRPELAGRTAAFGEWATDALARKDVETLIDHRREGPGADVSRATPERFAPLQLTVGPVSRPGGPRRPGSTARGSATRSAPCGWSEARATVGTPVRGTTTPPDRAPRAQHPLSCSSSSSTTSCPRVPLTPYRE